MHGSGLGGVDRYEPINVMESMKEKRNKQKGGKKAAEERKWEQKTVRRHILAADTQHSSADTQSYKSETI